MSRRRVAVLLNGSRRADPATERELAAALDQPGVTVARTASLAEARAALHRWVSERMDVILFGGGDGALSMGMSLLAAACRGRRHPAIGVLRLGTGNAFAHARGIASGLPGVRAQLARALDPEHRFDRFRPLETVGMRAPFCGFGIDAQLIGDHAAITARVTQLERLARLTGLSGLSDLTHRALPQRTGAVLRYAVSIASRSLPHLALRARPQVVITNLGAPAVRVDRDGREAGPALGAGTILWQGACTMAAASTIPTFGFGLRMFQYAGRRADRFHLRASDAGLLEILRNTRAAFAGTYTSEHVYDFLAERVMITASVPSPFEAGGEAMGLLDQVEIALGPELMIV